MCRRKSRPRPRPSDARNQTRHVGHREGILAGRDHTQVGNQRGEGIVGDLGLGRRDDRHQRGLARRREADQPDVGDRLELQGEVAGLPGLAQQCETRGLAGSGSQRGITQAAATAGGRLESGARADQVGQQPAVLVQHDGAVGNLDLQVRAGRTVTVVAHPLLARRRGHVRAEMEVQQRVDLRVDDEDDAAAAAAVAPVGAAQRLELLAVNRCAAVAAGTRPRMYDDPIDESRHRAIPLIGRGRTRGAQARTSPSWARRCSRSCGRP